MNFKVLEYDSLSSTNDTAMGGDFDHGAVVMARTQTGGRGQRGNVWSASGEGVNLTFSLVIKPTHIAVYEQFMISMMTALASAEAISSYEGVECLVKWPNDLYVDNNKIGGILIEHQLMGSEMITRSVIGVGINVGQMEFSSGIPNPTSLSLLGVQTSSGELLERFCAAFGRYYSMDMETIKGLFMARLWNSKCARTYRDQETGEVFVADCVAVEPDSGRMTLRDTLGQERGYWFKEVSIVL